MTLTERGWVPTDELEPKPKKLSCRLNEQTAIGSEWCGFCWRWHLSGYVCPSKQIRFVMTEVPEGKKPAVLGQHFRRVE